MEYTLTLKTDGEREHFGSFESRDDARMALRVKMLGYYANGANIVERSPDRYYVHDAPYQGASFTTIVEEWIVEIVRRNAV